MFKYSQRRQFFNAWLIAIACQHGQLLSQFENPIDPYNLQPKDGQWPVSSTNDWEGQDYTPSTFFSEDADPQKTFEEQYSITPFEHSTPSSRPIEPQQPQPESKNQTETEKQNFITFDPDLKDAPDREQHPLTDEGKAKAYSFDNEIPNKKEQVDSTLIDKKPSQPTSKEPPVKQDSAGVNEKELETKEKTPPSLSEGKGNIKFVKKRPDPVPPAQRLEEALKQPEEVIGKTMVTDPMIGMTDHQEDSEPSNNVEADEDDASIDDEETIKLPPSPTQSTSETPTKTAHNGEVAQNLTPAVPPTLNNSPSSQSKENVEAGPHTPTIITPVTADPDPIPATQSRTNKGLKEVSINFNNVAMVEYIRFISRISNKNFIFDDEDLQFNVTIVSEEPTTIENLMTALLQELRIRDLSLIEQGNNIIIHRNPRVRSPARIVADENKVLATNESELVTRVFRLNTLDPVKASEIIRPLISEDALIEVLRDTNNLIITDLVTNVNKVSQLISTLDAPNSGVTIGQYVVRNAFVDSLVDLANKILQPIAQGNPFVLVPHPVSNSIFIVSNSFIVEKALAILQNLDLNEGRTKILSLETLQPAYENFNPAYPTNMPSNGLPGAPGSSNGRIGTQPGGAASQFQGGLRGPGSPGSPGSPGVPGAAGGGFGGPGFQPGSMGQGGAAGLFGPGGGEFGPGGIDLGGYGPGGQYPNQESIPGSFPLGGLSTEGRLTPPHVIGQGSPFGQGPAFGPGGIGSEGRPSAIFDENRSFAPGGIGAASRWANELPVGHIERTLFFIYKLRYRKGDSIEIALRKIANSLQLMNTANSDLISAINSIQWIESSNALIFTGTATALDKVRELILEVDVPLRQIFIEMLILDTTIRDSLSYSVDWVNRFGGGTTTGEEGFIDNARGLGDSSGDSFLTASEAILSSGSVIPPAAASPLPVATNFLNSGGFVAGVIGTHLTHNGTQFSSIGALVRAIHSDVKADIIMNPKIITEDNNPAEIFVGSTDRYKTQSITNDLGSLVTNNFQFIDVGTTLRVTPLIGNNGIVTLEIVQETTSESPTANTGANGQDFNLIEVLNKTRTVTKVHVPNGFFVVLSGMIRDNQVRTYSRIPCLGGIPIIGCFGKSQTNVDSKRNLMLFIRPLIIESEDEYEDITRRQQDVYREKSKFRRSWNYEIDEALNFGSIRSTDPDDMNCSINERQQR